jgi:hypothetical protein
VDDREDGRITIDKTEYDRLVEADRVLGLLEAGGVDHWEGYSDAFRDEETGEWLG